VPLNHRLMKSTMRFSLAFQQPIRKVAATLTGGLRSCGQKELTITSKVFKNKALTQLADKVSRPVDLAAAPI